LNFVEIDAATNSGKADIQKITEELQYNTYSGGRKLYLFDESHQLSKDALDALLKPLEENIAGSDDKKLVCIFCTTEPEKMRNTILSRCAPAFIIKPVSPPMIAKRLEYVCQKENIYYDLSVLELIAEITECHIRDALKSLEGISLLGDVNLENTTDYLSLGLNTLYLDLLISLGDEKTSIEILKQLLQKASPTTIYERLSFMCLLAYQIHIGAANVPVYLDRDKLVSLGDTFKDSLLGFVKRLTSRPFKPTDSMLVCDIVTLTKTESVSSQHSPVIVQKIDSSKKNSTPPLTNPGNISVVTLPGAGVKVDLRAVKKVTPVLSADHTIGLNPYNPVSPESASMLLGIYLREMKEKLRNEGSKG
jgi:DNA polymerase III gamma/tau subunit